MELSSEGNEDPTEWVRALNDALDNLTPELRAKILSNGEGEEQTIESSVISDHQHQEHDPRTLFLQPQPKKKLLYNEKIRSIFADDEEDTEQQVSSNPFELVSNETASKRRKSRFSDPVIPQVSSMSGPDLFGNMKKPPKGTKIENFRTPVDKIGTKVAPSPVTDFTLHPLAKSMALKHKMRRLAKMNLLGAHASTEGPLGLANIPSQSTNQLMTSPASMAAQMKQSIGLHKKKNNSPWDRQQRAPEEVVQSTLDANYVRMKAMVNVTSEKRIANMISTLRLFLTELHVPPSDFLKYFEGYLLRMIHDMGWTSITPSAALFLAVSTGEEEPNKTVEPANDGWIKCVKCTMGYPLAKFACAVCGYVFKTMPDLYVHELELHNRRVHDKFSCFVCGVEFGTDPYALRLHNQQLHLCSQLHIECTYGCKVLVIEETKATYNEHVYSHHLCRICGDLMGASLQNHQNVFHGFGGNAKKRPIEDEVPHTSEPRKKLDLKEIKMLLEEKSKSENKSRKLVEKARRYDLAPPKKLKRAKQKKARKVYRTRSPSCNKKYWGDSKDRERRRSESRGRQSKKNRTDHSHDGDRSRRSGSKAKRSVSKQDDRSREISDRRRQKSRSSSKEYRSGSRDRRHSSRSRRSKSNLEGRVESADSAGASKAALEEGPPPIVPIARQSITGYHQVQGPYSDLGSDSDEDTLENRVQQNPESEVVNVDIKKVSSSGSDHSGGRIGLISDGNIRLDSKYSPLSAASDVSDSENSPAHQPRHHPCSREAVDNVQRPGAQDEVVIDLTGDDDDVLIKDRYPRELPGVEFCFSPNDLHSGAIATATGDREYFEGDFDAVYKKLVGESNEIEKGVSKTARPVSVEKDQLKSTRSLDHRGHDREFRDEHLDENKIRSNYHTDDQVPNRSRRSNDPDSRSRTHGELEKSKLVDDERRSRKTGDYETKDARRHRDTFTDRSQQNDDRQLERLRDEGGHGHRKSHASPVDSKRSQTVQCRHANELPCDYGSITSDSRMRSERYTDSRSIADYEERSKHARESEYDFDKPRDSRDRYEVQGSASLTFNKAQASIMKLKYCVDCAYTEWESAATTVSEHCVDVHYSCPNSTCSLLFPSTEKAVDHHRNDPTCGSDDSLCVKTCVKCHLNATPRRVICYYCPLLDGKFEAEFTCERDLLYHLLNFHFPNCRKVRTNILCEFCSLVIYKAYFEEYVTHVVEHHGYCVAHRFCANSIECVEMFPKTSIENYCRTCITSGQESLSLSHDFSRNLASFDSYQGSRYNENYGKDALRTENIVVRIAQNSSKDPPVSKASDFGCEICKIPKQQVDASRCTVCDESFWLSCELYGHYVVSHRKVVVGNYGCEFCPGVYFPDEPQRLCRHLNGVHGFCTRHDYCTQCNILFPVGTGYVHLCPRTRSRPSIQDVQLPDKKQLEKFIVRVK